VLSGFVAISVSAAKTGMELQSLSARFNMTAEQLQRWQYIAAQVGVENSELRLSINKVQEAIGDIAQGETNAATTALQNLGITSANATTNMSYNLETIVANLGKVDNAAVQSAYAYDIFGQKMGAAILAVVKNGGEGLEELKQEFAELGYLSNEDVDKLAGLNQEVTKLKYAFSNVRNELGVALIPLMKGLTDFMQNNVIPTLRRITAIFDSMSDSTKKAIGGVLLALAALAPVLLMGAKFIKLFSMVGTGAAFLGKTLVGLLSTVKAVFSGFTFSINGLIGVFKNLWAALSANPIGLILTVLALLIMSSEDLRKSLGELIAMLGETLSPIMDVLMDLLKSLMPIFKIVGDVLAVVINAVMELLKPLLDIVKIILTALSDLAHWDFSSLGKNFINGIKNFAKGFTDFFSNPVKGVQTWWGNITGTSKKEETPIISDTIDEAGQTLDGVPPTTYVENDNSTKNFDINITVETLGEDIDVDKLVREINIKLAEQM
jgi:hypothetical protein